MLLISNVILYTICRQVDRATANVADFVTLHLIALYDDGVYWVESDVINFECYIVQHLKTSL